MAEIKPILSTINPFDAMLGTSIYYIYTGSAQSKANNLRITDATTGLAVYDFLFEGVEKVHHLPPNVLVNGKKYKAKLRVKMTDGTYSPYSNEVPFIALATPVLDIESIDGHGYVYNSDVTFVARYSQSDGEVVKSYRFRLYNEHEELIKSFPIHYPSDAGIVLTETIEKLEKGKGYFVECSIETRNGVTWSQRERFIPLYYVPSINGVIQTTNDSDEGFVRIATNLKQMVGTQVRATDPNDTYISDNYDYVDNDWIVVPADNPLIFKGLGMNRASDFVMKVWCKGIPDNSMFLELSPKDETGIIIQLWKYDDRIIAVKQYGDVTSRHRSNIIQIPDDAQFMLYVRAIEHRIDLDIQMI